MERNVATFISESLHEIPRLSFMFRRVSNVFQVNPNSAYIQSLVFLMVGVLAVGGIFLLIITVTWLCQCCTHHDGKTRRRVRRLSTLLFVISVFGFLCLGTCLFGNEHMNRGITSSVVSIDDVSRNLKRTLIQCDVLNDTRSNSIRDIQYLTSKIQEEASVMSQINKTKLDEARLLMESMSDEDELIGQHLAHLKMSLEGAPVLDKVKIYGERIELERWMLCVTLLSIMLIVLFVGVISFCRRSKKGTIMFSGLGLAIFVVGWLLLSVVSPALVALADFCSEADPFIHETLSNDTTEVLKFYKDCDPQSGHRKFPPVTSAVSISSSFMTLQNKEQKLNTLLSDVVNNNAEFANGVYSLGDDISLSMKEAGVLEATLSCYNYHDDIIIMEEGLCTVGIIGATILNLSLLLFGLFMSILLLIVSRSWSLFTPLPSGYMEVDDGDPFYPRGNDTVINDDIYGPHVYNLRTHYTTSLRSTGTAAANGIAVNGAANQPSASTALLDSDETNTTLWQSGAVGLANTSLANAPPAVGSNSMARSVYPSASDDSSPAFRSRSYRQQFDV
ncbi:hypothetical protein AB6A40_007655 [Gnathostoma spinigerum]|uniref:Protein tweety homolog n=1 Tax=Gnathostoma spinigerum TaxID=75299 RepID=A0ABD6EMD3_9BILA